MIPAIELTSYYINIGKIFSILRFSKIIEEAKSRVQDVKIIYMARDAFTNKITAVGIWSKVSVCDSIGNCDFQPIANEMQYGELEKYMSLL